MRVDQPGTMLRDFQTERPLKGDPMPLTHRCYLADAKFLAALGATGHFSKSSTRRFGTRAGRFTWDDVHALPLSPSQKGCTTSMPTCATPWLASPGLSHRGSRTATGAIPRTSSRSCATPMRVSRPSIAPTTP